MCLYLLVRMLIYIVSLSVMLFVSNRSNSYNVYVFLCMQNLSEFIMIFFPLHFWEVTNAQFPPIESNPLKLTYRSRVGRIQKSRSRRSEEVGPKEAHFIYSFIFVFCYLGKGYDIPLNFVIWN